MQRADYTFRRRYETQTSIVDIVIGEDALTPLEVIKLVGPDGPYKNYTVERHTSR